MLPRAAVQHFQAAATNAASSICHWLTVVIRTARLTNSYGMGHGPTVPAVDWQFGVLHWCFRGSVVRAQVIAMLTNGDLGGCVRLVEN